MDSSPFKKFKKRKQTKEQKATTVYLDSRAEEKVEEEEVTPKPRSTANKVGVVIGALVVVPVGFMLLWNWLMPFIFGLPKLTLLQTFGLSILVSWLSPRKIGFGKKQNVNQSSKEYDVLNKNLEDLLQDLSTQFRA